MEMHFATLWEQIADTIGDRTALIHGDNKVTWSQFDDRAARIAGFLTSRGHGVDSKAGIYAYNSNEHIEAEYAAFKMRAGPINVNYRYLADELVYLLDNSDSEVIFYQACFADRIEEIRAKLPGLKTFIQIQDNSGNALLEGAFDYETIIAETDPMPRIERKWDDLYMLYTGGTTGMPKGVMYYNGEFAASQLAQFEPYGISPPPTNLEEAAAAIMKLAAANALPITLSACPLMHGTGMWGGVFAPLCLGGTVVTIDNSRFDADELWQTIERNSVTNIVIVGDAFGNPMLSSLRKAKEEGRSYDLSTVRSIMSSGVMWSHEVKKGLLEFADMTLTDALASTEGSMARSTTTRDNIEGTAEFELMETSKVFDENDEEIVPGSGKTGLLANGGRCPVGYYKDPVKSAVTFREVKGQRYSFPGDFATVEAGGKVKLLGRGSMCINTMGEKVFPEEVEEAIKTHPAIYDCLVAGVKDAKFGERVTAVVSVRPGMSADEAGVVEHVKTRLAGYKKPKNVFFVDVVQRATNGKADYKWAKAKVTDEAAKIGVGV
ncbi:MAG: acyl-CoA synthetase [Pseudomonadales bacterium]|nr:acyl-CoA synthetase [Pseudomonadales bacterium]